MKLKTLGVILVALLAVSALVFLLCLLTVANQFDVALRSINTSYSGVVLPLRQIDANTKNLRFHLYACFMHNPALPISAAHNHPIALHFDSIAAEIRKNQALWSELAAGTRQMPQVDLLQLRDLYDQFYLNGVAPSLRAAQRGDWDGIVRPITATLSDYLKFERLLQDKLAAMQLVEQHHYDAIRHWQHDLFVLLFVIVLLVLASATLLSWRTISQHGVQLLMANRGLLQTSERLQLATTAASIGIWDWDVAADALLWDEQSRRLYGLGPQQSPTSLAAWLDWLAPSERAGAQAMIGAALRGAGEFSTELRILWPDGTERFIQATGQTHRDVQGQPLRMIGVQHDVTERRLVERELLQHREHLEELVTQRTAAWQLAAADAEAASRAKSLFLSNMSHELRTPMNAIIGFSTLMQRDAGQSDEQRQNLAIISRSGEHLLSLINDVLDMSKIEAGRVNLELAAFDLHAMMRDVVDLMQERAETKGLSLQLQQSSKVPRCIRGDEGKLRQVLINLLGNAVKFTARGGVVLRIDVGGEDASAQLCIEIEDSGSGIAVQDQAHIFEPFVQVGIQSEQKGTGLGLTITRQFVELMGGIVRLNSMAGHGTRFCIELPLTPASADDVVVPATASRRVLRLAPGQPAYRVLVVEDQADNALLIERLLIGAGFAVEIATDGGAGVAAFVRSQPHFIWMDRRMPLMDGIEACRRIRALPGGEQVKIVGLTASILVEEKGELLSAGMDDIVCKPYAHSEIFDCMARLLHLSYVYEESDPDTHGTNGSADLDRLARLPATLHNAFLQALFDFDAAAIDATVAAIALQDASLGTVLATYIEQSNHSPILQALQLPQQPG